MPALFLAALLPWLYWDQGTTTASAVKQAGIDRLYVPPDQVAAWQAEGFDARGSDPAQFVKIQALGVVYRMDEANATNTPWVDGNGWRFERDSKARYYYDTKWRKATLAAAEAYMYGVEAVVHPDPRDLGAFGRMLAFLGTIDRPPLPVRANIGIIDDGSDETGEVMNLLARRNLLFRVIPAPDPQYDLTVKIGTKEYPKEEAEDPGAFATGIRQKLTDEKRLLRIYGSDVVLGRVTGDGGQVRLHLINYGGNKVDGLRVRVRGEYARGTLAAFEEANTLLADYAVAGGATEFSIPEMGVYAVVDLKK